MTRDSTDKPSDTPPSNDNVNHTNASSSLDFRRDVVGKATVQFSDYINDNLILARYVAAATIGALTVYGISQTPLFFRYRTVADIPSTLFRGRRKIKGRLLRSSTATDANQPIRVHVRHLSPLERVLSKRLFDALLKWHPAAAVGVRPQDNKRDLLQVEIAGIRSTEYYLSSGSSSSSSAYDAPGEWLNRLAANHTVVTMQLLGRRVVWNPPNEQSASSLPEAKKRQIPGLSTGNSITDENANQIAVARLYYRPKPTQLFPTDLAYSMVRWGRADICANGLYGTHASSNERLLDTTQDVKDVQADAKYMDELAKAEYQAAAETRGMWADSSIRQKRSDLLAEVDFQEKATLWQKLWRRLRGG